MQRSRREQWIFLLAVLFLAGPFVAALIRAFSTGTDFRMLWMAIASFLAMGATMAVGTARSREGTVVVALSVAAFVVAAIVAASVGILLGASAAPGVWAVAIVFGLFFAVGGTLYGVSRPRAV